MNINEMGASAVSSSKMAVLRLRAILCYVLIWSVFKTKADGNICSKPCSCLGHLVDCSNSTLYVPADLPSWVRILDLSSNKLHGQSFLPLNHLEELTELKLSYNNFIDIPDLPPSIIRLSSLVLSHNEINITTSSCQTLNKLPALIFLDLSNNHISDLSGFACLNMSNLKELNLNNNLLQKLEGGQFEGLVKLHDLRINKNKLKSISNDAFKHLKVLQNLDLNRNHLTKLESLTFQDLSQLTSLRLRRNDIAHLDDGVFWGLKNISILLLDHNNVANISKSWLYGLESLHLLNLSHNHIKEMDPECWSFNPNLVELDLSHNQLKMIGRTSFNHLSKLQKLRLNVNQIQYIEEGAFIHTPELSELELNGNELSWAGEEMNGIFNSLSNLEVLSLAENQISSINYLAFSHVNNLKVLNLANNSLLSIQENPWIHMSTLMHLSLNVSSLMCDCSLKWLPVWLKQQPFSKETRPVCNYPFSLHGISIMDIAPENFSCEGIPNPHIIEEPQSKMVLLGTNFTLQCRANSSSEEKISFRWKRDNVEVKSSTSMSIKYSFQITSDPKEQTSELHIYNASLKDAGIYQCFASNSFGSAHSGKANVTVVVFPKFTKIPEDLQVKTGSIARLPCAAEGLPEPKMSWQKDGGNDFPAARERRMHVMPDDDVFFIVNVKPFDMGVYSCMAHNDAGVNITNASLTILEMPSFLKLMENKEVRVGQAVVLECLSTGSPRPRLKWFKDGIELRPSERYHFTAEDELLIIRNTQPEDAGKYVCELSNPLGVEKGYSKLTINPSSGSLIINDDMAGIIVIAVVCCAVCTSVVWVVIIYQTRKHMTRVPHPPSGSSGTGLSHAVDLKMASDHSPMPLLVYGHPGGQIANQIDTDSEHSSKDSGTGDSKRSHSHEDLLPPPESLLQSKGSEIGDERDGDFSDEDSSNLAVGRLVGPSRSPVKAPPFVASVKHPNRQRRTNHDRCYRLSMSTQTATVHAPRPSSYHCLSLASPPPPQEV
ncbi:Leucine-rich repeats and immunoglobulin-like domains protein 3 [Frankliniella fusca]|uniref:Leucine-rich repeats and immunoglobulin-like domains protein 3 n=1 Tax=Frankliniella fusca TaxID=407009 RepID=A0AAE1GTM0_9NEOP|nr:Leucine-rich repeats and immunoglobulin-like domains protein 3 [Frankliniella fusca]